MIKTIPYVLVFCISLLLAGCTQRNGLPDLKETYASKDTRPFGGKIAFSILQNGFPNNYVQSTKIPFADGSLASNDTASLYFCLAKNFFTNEVEIESILDYVYRGNSFFLSAANIDTILLNKLYCKTSSPDKFGAMPGKLFEETSVRLIPGVDSSRFSYFYRPFSSYFSDVHEKYCRIIGYNGNDEVNCVVFFWGKGKMFLHTDPRAFSNYFLLKNENHRYLVDLLQLIGPMPEHIYWNDFYCHMNRKTSTGSFSSLDEIQKYPPLEAAFWVALLLLLCYVLFAIKRRQRIINQLAPNQNSSVAFTSTIARLYLQKKDNKNIADKMITYFNEYIRSNYFLYANPGSHDFIEALSRKSGVSLEKTVALYRAIDHANRQETLDDYQLLSLNEQIQQFYKKRK